MRATVTVYGEDPPYCSSDTKFLADFQNCVTNTTVNQFSVDCQDASAATPVPSKLQSGLSGGAKAGIAVAAVVVGLGLVALLVGLVVRNNRRKRRSLTPKALEADSNPAAPPYSAELPPHEKKAAVELPLDTNVPVEAPGDEHWPPPQELEGDIAARSEMEGSTPAAQEKPGVDVKDVKQDPDSKH